MFVFRQLCKRQSFYRSEKLNLRTSSVVYQNPSPEPDKSTDKATKQIKLPKVKSYTQRTFLGFLQKYVDNRIERLERHFEKLSPSVFKVYKLFKTGLWNLLGDTKQCYKVTVRGLSDKELHEFTLNELENYRQIPADIRRVAPFLAITLIPMVGNFLILPVLGYPKLLCRHFWTPEYRLQAAEEKLRKRLRYYQKVFSFMENESSKITDEGLRRVFREMLLNIEQGIQPEVEEILDIKRLFVEQPFNFDMLYRRHRIYMQWHLSHSWNFPGRKKPMYQYADLLRCANIAMEREGVNNMSIEQLQHACMYRGLMVSGLSQQDLQKYLNSWIQINNNIDESSISLLLHSHLLLTHGHPNNHTHLRNIMDETSSASKQDHTQGFSKLECASGVRNVDYIHDVTQTDRPLGGRKQEFYIAQSPYTSHIPVISQSGKYKVIDW